MDIVSLYQKDQPFVRVSAPMVRYSKLQFRLLVRRHGVDLAYSPMVMSDAFLHSAAARAADFTTCPADRPLVAQVACQSGPDFAACARDLAPIADGIDLNCGCPQRWAMQEGFGAALLKRPEVIEDLVKAARAAVPRWRVVRTPGPDGGGEAEERRVPFSVSVKIRLVPCSPRATGGDTASSASLKGDNNVELTTELVRRAAHMGVDWVTIHGRTPSQGATEPARWHDVGQVIAAHVPHATDTSAPLPIFLNGDVRTLEEAREAHRVTGCQGVMVARGLQQDPSLFQPENPWTLYREWLELCKEHPESLPFGSVVRHAYWILERHIGKKEKNVLQNLGTAEDMIAFANKYGPPVNNNVE